jgi:hypothetical protein
MSGIKVDAEGEIRRLFNTLSDRQRIPIVMTILTDFQLVNMDIDYYLAGVDPLTKRPGWYSKYKTFITPGKDTSSNFNELITSIAKEEYGEKYKAKQLFYELFLKQMKMLISTTDPSSATPLEHPNTVSSAAQGQAPETDFTRPLLNGYSSSSVSSSSVASASSSKKPIPDYVPSLFTSYPNLSEIIGTPGKFRFSFHIHSEGFTSDDIRMATINPLFVPLIERYVTFTTPIYREPGNDNEYLRRGVINGGHKDPITINIKGENYPVPVGTAVLGIVEVNSDHYKPYVASRKINIIIKLEPKEKGLFSGGAKKNRRRGTKRARRGRRRSSRKN